MEVPRIYRPGIIAAFTRSRGIKQEYTDYFDGMYVWDYANIKNERDVDKIDRWFKTALSEVGMTLPMYAKLGGNDQDLIYVDCKRASEVRILAKDIDAHMMDFDSHGYADSFDYAADFEDVETRIQRLVAALKTTDGIAVITETMQDDIEVDKRPGDDQILERLKEWEKKSEFTTSRRSD